MYRAVGGVSNCRLSIETRIIFFSAEYLEQILWGGGLEDVGNKIIFFHRSICCSGAQETARIITKFAARLWSPHEWDRAQIGC